MSVIFIHENDLPTAWEKSLFALKELNQLTPTQYDKEGDPLGLDAAAVIEIDNPFNEPRIHKRIIGGIDSLEVYRQEVLLGLHDHWINPTNGAWQYTYSERIFKYSVPGIEKPINQIEYVIKTLKDCSYSRRAQVVLWKAWEDAGISDPACLQRLFFRVINGKLDLHTHMRSNDSLNAAFHNIWAFSDIQRMVAEELNIPIGKYIHFADSYHVYGSRMKDLNNLLDYCSKHTMEEKTWATTEMQDIIDETKIKITASIEEEQLTGRKGI